MFYVVKYSQTWRLLEPIELHMEIDSAYGSVERWRIKDPKHRYQMAEILSDYENQETIEEAIGEGRYDEDSWHHIGCEYKDTNELYERLYPAWVASQ